MISSLSNQPSDFPLKAAWCGMSLIQPPTCTGLPHFVWCEEEVGGGRGPKANVPRPSQARPF